MSPPRSDPLAPTPLLPIAAACLIACACSRPNPLVICHNANCAGPPDPSQDDTIASLRESLAVRVEGRPAIDGVEIDVFWHGGQGRCLFAHDLGQPDPVPATDAAREIAAWLEAPGRVSWNGERFFIRMELKGHVGESFFDKHTEAQAWAHTGCALDLLEIFEQGARAGDRRIVVIFDSSAPKLLETLVQQPRWSRRDPTSRAELRLSADFVDSMPTGLALQKLSEFPRVNDVVFHAGWITDGHYQAFRSLDLDLTLWMFSATSETFSAIERFQPEAVLTSEAPLVRRWIER